MAIICGTRVTYGLPVLAAWLCGASVNLLDPGSSLATLEEQMSLVPAGIVVCGQEDIGKVITQQSIIFLSYSLI